MVVLLLHAPVCLFGRAVFLIYGLFAAGLKPCPFKEVAPLGAMELRFCEVGVPVFGCWFVWVSRCVVEG
jgi:hypothetical protein